MPIGVKWRSIRLSRPFKCHLSQPPHDLVFSCGGFGEGAQILFELLYVGRTQGGFAGFRRFRFRRGLCFGRRIHGIHRQKLNLNFSVTEETRIVRRRIAAAPQFLDCGALERLPYVQDRR